VLIALAGLLNAAMKDAGGLELIPAVLAVGSTFGMQSRRATA
jgi:hypothetical protein